MTVLVSLVIALGLGGCSRVQIAYNTADFAIELFASRYLGLDNRQVAAWRPILATALDQHRVEELPALSALLAQAANDIQTGLTDTRVSQWLDQLEPLYQRHARLFAATTAPLLAGLTETQVDILEQKFLEQAREDATDNEPATQAKRIRKRAERYVENVQWLTGELTPTQIELISAETAGFPDAITSWYAYRDQQRQALVALLRRQPDAEQIRSFLTHWLTDFRGLPADLIQARSQLRAGLMRLTVKLGVTLSEQQRRHAEQRLLLLSEDFDALHRAASAPKPGV